MTTIDMQDLSQSLLQLTPSFADRPPISTADGRLMYRGLFAEAPSIADRALGERPHSAPATKSQAPAGT